MAAANRISVDATVAADLSEPVGIFTLKVQKNVTEGFLFSVDNRET